MWEEGKGPEVVIELTSPSTYLADLGKKRAIYAELSVKEYYLFDPEGARLEPPFRGFRLKEGVLQPVAGTPREDGTLVFRSDVLGLELHGLGPSLHLVDPRSGECLPAPLELLARVQEERRRADGAEREIARLRAKLNALGIDPAD
ncbi:MAG: Uma2 family endonuclease [Planctomycetota bacterium]|nr:Uma2 family endonuclease [Planctomycetota bacterium]